MNVFVYGRGLYRQSVPPVCQMVYRKVPDGEKDSGCDYPGEEQPDQRRSLLMEVKFPLARGLWRSRLDVIGLDATALRRASLD